MCVLPKCVCLVVFGVLISFYPRAQPLTPSSFFDASLSCLFFSLSSNDTTAHVRLLSDHRPAQAYQGSVKSPATASRRRNTVQIASQKPGQSSTTALALAGAQILSRSPTSAKTRPFPPFETFFFLASTSPPLPRSRLLLVSPASAGSILLSNVLPSS